MKQIYKIASIFVILMLATTQIAVAYAEADYGASVVTPAVTGGHKKVIYSTDKDVYNRGDTVIFTLYNNKRYPITMDLNKIRIYDVKNRKLVYEVKCVRYGGNSKCPPFSVQPRGTYSREWEQNIFPPYLGSGQVPNGRYISIWSENRHRYTSNVFIITDAVIQ